MKLRTYLAIVRPIRFHQKAYRSVLRIYPFENTPKHPHLLPRRYRVYMFINIRFETSVLVVWQTRMGTGLRSSRPQ
jgi:hypothetical protein